ncbi:MAG: sugar phosphate isomerase/epimerase [Draconibacterium sp.]|nr:sugar phosphate isomerase/epimerase [Draconibacterium sp.]
MKPGIQTYSVRNQLSEDFEGTMEYIADVGYKHIEAYGLGPDGMFLRKITPKHYAKVIADLGMEFKATHCSYVDAGNAQKMVDAAKETGMEYLIVPAVPGNLRKSVDSWKAIAENFNKLGEMCNKVGLKFGYHNHAFEFEKIDGVIPQELLMSETEKDLVHFEADLFWVTKGGYDPIKLLNKFPGRVKIFHVKDATKDLEGTTVGEGIIDFEAIFKVGKKDAIEYYFVEDERTDAPFKNIKADYEFISSQKYMR